MTEAAADLKHDSMKRCSNKNLTEHMSVDNSKFDAMPFTTTTAESALDQLLLNDEDMPDFEM